MGAMGAMGACGPGWGEKGGYVLLGPGTKTPFDRNRRAFLFHLARYKDSDKGRARARKAEDEEAQTIRHG